MNKNIRNILKKFGDDYELIGFLNGNDITTNLSDIDIFFLDNSNNPADYFNKCQIICESLMNELPNILTFSSFKQQVLLKSLSKNRALIPLHILYYLSPSHLVIREVNTLPKFVQDCIDIIKVESNVFERIRNSYNNRNDLLNSETIRIFYYFDILNETTPIVFNGIDERLPLKLIQLEVLHKLKFISSYLGYELLSYKYSIPQETISLENMELLMKENNLEYLAYQKKEINLILEKDIELNIEEMLSMLKMTYELFNQVKTLTQFL